MGYFLALTYSNGQPNKVACTQVFRATHCYSIWLVNDKLQVTKLR